MIVCGTSCDVVHHQCTGCASVIWSGNGTKTLLTSSVPTINQIKRSLCQLEFKENVRKCVAHHICNLIFWPATSMIRVPNSTWKIQKMPRMSKMSIWVQNVLIAQHTYTNCMGTICHNCWRMKNLVKSRNLNNWIVWFTYTFSPWNGAVNMIYRRPYLPQWCT